MKKLFILISVLVVLSGCSKNNQTSLDIYNHIEQAILLEGNENGSDKLNKLEEEEKKIFASIEQLMSEGKKEEITGEATKALDNVKARQQFVQEKVTKVKKSKEEFELAVQLMEKKKVGESFIKVAKERYTKNEEMLMAYENGLKHDENLYTLFSSGDLNSEKLNAEAKALNESYEKVLNLTKELTELTTSFNEEKNKLYTELGIETK